MKPANFLITPDTLRDRFAVAALQGLIASAPMCDRTQVDKRKWAVVAYEFADAMLAVRSSTLKRKPRP